MLLYAKGTLDSVFDLLTVLFIFALTILLAYFTTRFVGSYQKTKGKRGMARVSNIETIETSSVTKDKYIQIVRVGNKYLCIGVGKEDITLLAELSEDELELPKEGGVSPSGSFKSILDRVRKSGGSEKAEVAESDAQQSNENNSL